MTRKKKQNNLPHQKKKRLTKCCQAPPGLLRKKQIWLHGVLLCFFFSSTTPVWVSRISLTTLKQKLSNLFMVETILSNLKWSLEFSFGFFTVWPIKSCTISTTEIKHNHLVQVGKRDLIFNFVMWAGIFKAVFGSKKFSFFSPLKNHSEKFLTFEVEMSQIRHYWNVLLL